MNVQRALKVIPREAKLTAETQSNKFGSGWNIVARLDDGYERIVTSFAANGAFEAAHWLAEYDRRVEEDRIEVCARAIYEGTPGSDPSVYPWPCNGAPRYRIIAKFVLEALDNGEASR
jgi:hypothetical protein